MWHFMLTHRASFCLGHLDWTCDHLRAHWLVRAALRAWHQRSPAPILVMVKNVLTGGGCTLPGHRIRH